MLNFEGLWGGSEVAKQNNNLAGITWSSIYKGHPDIPKTKGSARPANEGGHYVKYNSVSDFLKDWTYLVRPNHFYKVTGNKSFNDSIRGLFIVGGAKYDYAASGYEHYLAGMNARKNVIEKHNPGKLGSIKVAYDASKTITGEEITVVEPSIPSTNKSVNEVAKEVIKGLWGNGEDRVTRLTDAGYNYDEVQAYVNQISAPNSLKQLDEIAKDVLAGKYGNGKDRTEKLRQEGYDVNAVQSKVNELLKQDLTAVAKDVIRGQYGNGAARVRNLRAVGYNPDDVQKRVNELI